MNAVICLVYDGIGVMNIHPYFIDPRYNPPGF